MALNPLTIAHLGIGRRPIVAALLGIWDELMEVLASPRRGGQSPGPRRAYPQGRRRRIQLTSAREEARRRALRRDA